MENPGVLRPRASRERVLPSFTPRWEGPIEGWTVNYTRRNLWRVIPLHDFEDLVQDGFFRFLVCVERYPEVVDPPHFMRLYQRAFTNHIHDLADARGRSGTVAADVNLDLIPDSHAASDFAEVEMRLKLEGAPAPLLQLLASLRELPDDLLEFARDRASGARETTEERLQRLARCSAPMRELVAEWLAPGAELALV